MFLLFSLSMYLFPEKVFKKELANFMEESR